MCARKQQHEWVSWTVATRWKIDGVFYPLEESVKHIIELTNKKYAYFDLSLFDCIQSDGGVLSSLEERFRFSEYSILNY